MMKVGNKANVSTIIPTYNRAKYVTRAIDSVLAQTYSNYEIIVVDDGSTDDTKQVLKPYIKKIRYVYQDNAGPAAARNRGIKLARGEWLAFLDSDDAWLQKKLETQLIECMRLKADLCFHDLILRDAERGKDIASWNLYINEETLGQEHLNTNILSDAYKRMMITGHLFITTTFLVKRAAVLEVGGFREDLRTSEDLELYFRLAARYRVAYVAEALAIYGPGTGRLTNRKLIYEDRIKAIRIAISERLQFKDYERARLGKTGVLQQIRSLAGEYRRSGKLFKSSMTYLYWMITQFMPTYVIANK